MRRFKAFKKVAIANRGEVAVRIIRACQDLGIQTLLLHSEPDVRTLAYRLADEVYCIGPGPTSDSYLNIERNILAAVARGADAIHPGFGFLSENAQFAQACANNGIEFIGPSAEAIALFGDKIQAKALAQRVGLPTIPGYQGVDQALATLLREVERIGYPVMVKAAAGGGGRGLKVIRRAEEAQELIESAQREGLSSFGSSVVFLEKYLDRARHIEVQIFGDASGRVHALGERDCSVQRRHQKIIEEAPAAELAEDLREQIVAAALRLAEAGRYQGAGTVEFLVQDDQFFFMEMNTRLQVEHPVTELVTGRDLVKAQILTAMGRNLFWDEPKLIGHAIECRIYAEDPYQGGLPSTGRILGLHWPQGPGRRFDVGLEEGDEVSSFYDSMIAKIIVHDETRPRAIAKMVSTLRDSVIFGVQTNIPLLLKILAHPEFQLGRVTTRFFGDHFANALSPKDLDAVTKEVLEEVARLTPMAGVHSAPNMAPNPWVAKWGER